MNPSVGIQVSSVGEAPATLTAGVRLLSGVDSAVVFESCWSREALPAALAAVRFLPRVNSHVNLEVCFVRAANSTEMAHKKLPSDVR